MQEPQICVISQREHLSISPSGSLGAAPRELQQSQDLARYFEICRLRLGFYERLQIWGLLMGRQGRCIRFPRYICFWDSRNTAAHYHMWYWPQWTVFSVEMNNTKRKPLLDPWKILFPPRHLKLGLMRQFVTSLVKESAVFKTSSLSCSKSQNLYLRWIPYKEYYKLQGISQGKISLETKKTT